MNSKELADEFLNIIKDHDLSKAEPKVAQQLITIKESLLDPQSPDFSIWLGRDLTHAIDTNGLVHRMRLFYRDRQLFNLKWMGRLAFFRNFLVLAPITWTWYSLYHATREYGRYLNSVNNDEISRTSFLVLWEGAFGKTIPEWQTFSGTALIAFIFLAVILLLTIVLHWQYDVGEVFAERRSVELSRRLDSALWWLAHIAAEHAPKPLDHVMAKFINSLETLATQGESTLDLLAAQQERLKELGDIRGQEIRELQTLSTEWGKQIKDLIQQNRGATRAYDKLHSSIEKLSDQLEIMQKHQDDLKSGLGVFLVDIRSINERVEHVSLSIKNVASQFESAATYFQVDNEELVHVADGLTQTAKSVGQGTADTAQRLKQASDELAQAAGSINQAAITITDRLSNTLAEQAQLASKAAQENQSLISSQTKLAKALEEERQGEQSVVIQLQGLSTDIQQGNQSLSTLLNQFNDISRHWEQQTKTMGTISTIMGQTTTIKAGDLLTFTHSVQELTRVIQSLAPWTKRI